MRQVLGRRFSASGRRRSHRGGTDRSPRSALALFAACAASLTACSVEPADGPLRVAVTVLPLAGFVDRVAPGLVETTAVIPAGANPVTHEPSLSDLREVAAADLVIEVGHPAFTWERTWLAELDERTAATRVTAIRTCSIVPDDPHAWLSPTCAAEMARAIAGAIAAALPGSADSVRASLDRFLSDVREVSVEAEAAFGAEPGGAFLTLHPAWGYLARDYGLEQLSILDHGSGDAGPGRLAGVIERARANGVRNVIVQPQFSSQSARIVARELGGRIVSLDPLERDWVAGMRRAIAVLSLEVEG